MLIAGLAKGDHEDYEDFYQRIKREEDGGDPARWLPTDEDRRLLKLETSVDRIWEWRLAIQRQVCDALSSIHAGGTVAFDVTHPEALHGRLATVELTVELHRDDGIPTDDIVAEITPARGEYRGDKYWWLLIVRILTSLAPPYQEWDTEGDIYSQIGEPGFWTTRADELTQLVDRRELASSEPGQVSHYAHERHLTESTVDGLAVRGLCGVFFVPTQDSQKLPKCPYCTEEWDRLPAR